jgi:hypothetical protein
MMAGRPITDAIPLNAVALVRHFLAQGQLTGVNVLVGDLLEQHATLHHLPIQGRARGKIISEWIRGHRPIPEWADKAARSYLVDQLVTSLKAVGNSTSDSMPMAQILAEGMVNYVLVLAEMNRQESVTKMVRLMDQVLAGKPFPVKTS